MEFFSYIQPIDSLVIIIFYLDFTAKLGWKQGLDEDCDLSSFDEYKFMQ